MRFDDASKIEEIVWQMRLADLPRSENRAIIQRSFNGDAPFDESKAEENNIQVNRNFLEGVNLMSQARRQWNQAFLKPGNYFSVSLDSGPKQKRREYAHIITRNANRYLKRSRLMMEQTRATGASVMLHGIGPTMWDGRRTVIPTPLPIASVMLPSETDLDFTNVSYVAVFREWTPAQLYEMTHGPKVDPGWNMPLVKSQLKYVGEQVQKQFNASAYQYMPERVEELIKQDLGMWASDAVPTVDVWDFYFREHEDGRGWYRRTILDWGIAVSKDQKTAPRHSNPDADGSFLYNSGKRMYARSLGEILQSNFGDTSATAPFKYHSVRSLGWMLWGIVDIQNRLSCKFTEALFEQLMWFFRVASNTDFQRLKRADFYHWGVIPQGIDWVKANERFTPDIALVQAGFARNRQIMSENAASFTQDFDKGNSGKEMTATETMARVNSVNALVSGMLTLAYTYEGYKYREIARRMCIKNNPDPIARSFRKACLEEGVPPELLDTERWEIEPERVLGAGNKTLEMAQAQFLQSIRQNVGPDAQREIDHIAIEANTDDPAMAERLAPIGGQKVISSSMHDAQLSTERIMRGLPIVPRPDMVYEDYVLVWLADLELMLQRSEPTGMATMEDVQGWSAMVNQIAQFLQIMEQNPEDKEKVRSYQDRLTQAANQIKALAQRLAEQMQSQNGNGAGIDPVLQAKIAGEEAKAALKLRNMETSHAARTAQKMVSAELAEQRKDREANAAIRRKNTEAVADVISNRLRSLTE